MNVLVHTHARHGPPKSSKRASECDGEEKPITLKLLGQYEWYRFSARRARAPFVRRNEIELSACVWCVGTCVVCARVTSLRQRAVINEFGRFNKNVCIRCQRKRDTHMVEWWKWLPYFSSLNSASQPAPVRYIVHVYPHMQPYIVSETKTHFNSSIFHFCCYTAVAIAVAIAVATAVVYIVCGSDGFFAVSILFGAFLLLLFIWHWCSGYASKRLHTSTWRSFYLL